ncbi:NUDIX domain-containing protein [Sphingomonas lenta]|uniref:GDP-mannose pyrophosphatase n=1 Tax=Sphingomonas lenta TaxID=1141887 RepID=A0A2A2SHF2_9SPHN|nr:NUDIX hydrolase [Sphingomonas lenta]PAX08648.1 ADP-ribose pyrophosphatase [Sphingomonas lenta]
MSDRLLSSERLIQGWFDVLRLRMALGGREVDRLLVEHPSGAAVLAYDPDRWVAMVVRETRAAVLRVGAAPLDEVVAGVAEDRDFVGTARREALEEAGLELRDLEPVARIWMTPSSTTERVHLFLAAYSPADRVALGGGLAEEDERVEAREVPLAELWRAAEAELVDAKTFMLLQALRIRRPELFD